MARELKEPAGAKLALGSRILASNRCVDCDDGEQQPSARKRQTEQALMATIVPQPMQGALSSKEPSQPRRRSKPG